MIQMIHEEKLTRSSQDQAYDRAHRFGQKRDVYIYKLKIDETVEERILLVRVVVQFFLVLTNL